MEETKSNINWLQLFLTVLIVLVTAGAVGGAVWYFMNQNDEAQQKSYNDSVSSLQKQIDGLKAKKQSSTETTNTTKEVGSTTGWKNFANTSPSFTFMYPPTEVVTKDASDSSLVYLSPDGTKPNMTLSVISEPSKNINPQLFFEAKVKSPGVPEPYTVIGNVTLGTGVFYQVDFNHQGQASTSLYYYSNGYAYTISFPTAQKSIYLNVVKSMTF